MHDLKLRKAICALAASQGDAEHRVFAGSYIKHRGISPMDRCSSPMDRCARTAAAISSFYLLDACSSRQVFPATKQRIQHNVKEYPMSERGFPSMTALLGLLAMAGYQNRDKLAEMFGGAGQASTPGAAAQSGIGGLLSQLKTSLGAASAGGVLSGGLGELVDRFKQSGHGDTANSWVGTGPNK